MTHHIQLRSALFLALMGALILPARLQASLDIHRPLISFVHQSWQTQQGLPQNSVLSLAQSKDGYLWIGTEEGLARFDGSHFAVIATGLQNKTITALLAGANGDLWIGTNGGGMAKLSDGVFTSFTTRNGLPNNSILSLSEDSRGVIWAGTDGGGLVAIDRAGIRVYTKNDGLPDSVVFAVAGSKDGTVWVGTRSGLVRCIAGRISDEIPELKGQHVRALVAAPNGSVWAGTTTEGLFHVTSNGPVEHFSKATGLGSDEIESLSLDNAGTLYIGSMDAGLLRFLDGKSIGAISDKQGLLGSEIHAVLEDREGDIWIGTAGGGLDCLKEGVFSTVSTIDGLPSDTILPILQDRNGALWIGSDRGLTVRDGTHVQNFSKENGLPDSLVLSLAQDPSGAIWAGTRRGLARYASGRWTVFATQDGLGSDYIAALFVDRAGQLWVGTRGGLSKYNGRFSNYTTHDGLSNNYVLSLAQDSTGAIWAGTEGGVTRIENGRFTNFTTRNGLSNDVVRSVYAAADGSIWFATNGGGLNLLRKGRFTAFRSARGLFDDSLHSILADGTGRLWLTCNRAVFSVELRQLYDFAEGKVASITPRVYGVADGLKTSEFNGGFQPASCRLRDGRLAFPTTGGVAIVEPASGVHRADAPNPIVERILVDQRDFSPSETVIVPPGRGQIEIQFTAPAFRSPNSIQFSYMLEGFDREWTQAGARRAAYYTNIPPGEYRFRVRVETGDATAETVLPFQLTPHFYQTLAFYALSSVIVLTICASVYGWRVNELRGRERRLLALVNEKTAALRDSERMLRRSRDELELRVHERTLELVRANQALQTEIFVRRQAESQMRSAKEEAEAASQGLRIILKTVSHELAVPLGNIQLRAETRLEQSSNEDEQQYLRSVAHAAMSLSLFVQGLSEAAAETEVNEEVYSG